MSYDLLIKRKESNISSHDLSSAVLNIQEKISFINFKKLNPEQYDGQIDGVTKCYVSYLPQEQTIQISANEPLQKYTHAFAAMLAMELKGVVFDPQKMEDIPTQSLSKDDLDGLRPSVDEIKHAADSEMSVYRSSAVMLLGQVSMGLFDFENNRGITKFLLDNAYGPIFINQKDRKGHDEEYKWIRQEFKDKLSIEVTADSYVVVRLKPKGRDPIPFVAIKKPDK